MKIRLSLISTVMAMQLRPCYDLGDGAMLSLRFFIISLYIESEVQLISVLLNVNDRCAQVAMLQMAIMNHILIMLGHKRYRQDGVGRPKGPGSVQHYPQTDGYSVGTMTN